jgi:hypothetical protein
MKARLMVKAVACIGALIFSSCGQSSPGSSVTQFKTVEMRATATPNPFRSPVPSGNSCTSGVISGDLFVPDVDATVDVSSSVYRTVTTGQPVFLGAYTVSLARANTASPVISEVIPTGFAGVTVPAGGSLSVSIPLTTPGIKNFLATDPGLHSCTPTSYSYLATINIIGTEEGGTNGTITATVPVIFSNVVTP